MTIKQRIYNVLFGHRLLPPPPSANQKYIAQLESNLVEYQRLYDDLLQKYNILKYDSSQHNSTSRNIAASLSRVENMLLQLIQFKFNSLPAKSSSSSEKASSSTLKPKPSNPVVYCSLCGKKLEIKRFGDSNDFSVEPCPKCLDTLGKLIGLDFDLVSFYLKNVRSNPDPLSIKNWK